jgi:ABC-type uncharacterized transport system substrate-binding protein
MISYPRFIIFLLLFWGPLVSVHSAAGLEKKFKVMVVMSYEASYPWVAEVRQGIESVIGNSCTLKYTYLNTKTNRRAGPGRAKEAYEEYKVFMPDGVIVSDDDAQSMFLVPYLKDRVSTPVMFCGVNAEPEAYGYPASNVSGVLEREPMKESLLFLKQLVPSVGTFGLVIEKSPTGMAVQKQLEEEADQYPVRFIGTRMAHTMEEAVTAVKEFRDSCDALIYITMEGITDPLGRSLSDKEILPVLSEIFKKPIFTNAQYRVHYGALGAVVKTGQEHGVLSSEMLMKAMKGTPVSELAITRNKFGRRILNVDMLKKLEINPKPFLVRSATLVRTEE